MASPPLPSAKVIHVDTRGAVILEEESPEVRAQSGISLSFIRSSMDTATWDSLDKGQSRDISSQLHRTGLTYRCRRELYEPSHHPRR